MTVTDKSISPTPRSTFGTKSQRSNAVVLRR